VVDQEIIVEGNKVTVIVDGKRVFEYAEPPGRRPAKSLSGNWARERSLFRA
jgi:hypothetical protein